MCKNSFFMYESCRIVLRSEPNKSGLSSNHVHPKWLGRKMRRLLGGLGFRDPAKMLTVLQTSEVSSM